MALDSAKQVGYMDNMIDESSATRKFGIRKPSERARAAICGAHCEHFADFTGIDAAYGGLKSW